MTLRKILYSYKFNILETEQRSIFISLSAKEIKGASDCSHGRRESY